MTEQPPSIWSMDRAAIERTLADGRSPRGEYSAADAAAIRTVLDRPDFERLSEADRAVAFVEARRSDRGVIIDATPDASAPWAAAAWVLLALSAGLSLYAAFGYETAIHSDADYVGGTLIPSRDTINIGLLQNQLMLFQAGLVGILCSLILLVSERVRRK